MSHDYLKVFIDGRKIIGFEDPDVNQSVSTEGYVLSEMSFSTDACAEDQPPDSFPGLKVFCVPKVTLFLPEAMRSDLAASDRPAPLVPDGATISAGIARNFFALTAKPVETNKAWKELHILFGSATSGHLALAFQNIKHPLDQARFLLLLQAFSPEKLGDVVKRVEAKTALEFITKHLVVIDRDGQTIALSFGNGGAEVGGLPTRLPDTEIAWACLNTLLEAKGLCGIDWKGAQLVLVTESTADITTPSSKRLYHAASDDQVIQANLEYIDGVVNHQIVIHISGPGNGGEVDSVVADEGAPAESASATAGPPETPPSPDESLLYPATEKPHRSFADGIENFITSSLEGAANVRLTAEPADGEEDPGGIEDEGGEIPGEEMEGEDVQDPPGFFSDEE